MTTHLSIKYARWFALASLLGTSSVFIFFMTAGSTGQETALTVGCYYIVISGSINIAGSVSFLVWAYEDKANRSKILLTCFALLFNILLMLAVCWATVMGIKALA